MIRDFVLNSSVALSWLHDDEHHEGAERLQQRISLGDTIMSVPPVWVMEIVNNLAMAERSRRIVPEAARQKLTALFMLPINIFAPGTSWPDFAEELHILTRRHGLTAYDACYLGLAQELGLPLATLDRQLAAAARKAGVQIVPELTKAVGK